MAGRMLPLLSLLLITVLFSHFLSRHLYGTFQSIWMYANLASVVMGFGFSTIIFSSPAGVLVTLLKQHRRVVAGTYSGIWLLVLSFFFIATGFPVPLKWLICFFIVLQNVNSITESWIIKHGHERNYFLINLVYSVLFFGWHYFVLATSFSLEKIVGGIVALSLIKLMVLTIFARHSYGVAVPAADAKKFFSHWVYIGFNDIINVTTKWVDKLILIYLLTPSDFAIFFNGSIEIPLLSILVGMTGSYMMMQISRRPDDASLAQTAFRENFDLLSSVMFPLFFLLMFFRQEFFLIFFGPDYLPSVPVFAISILILPLRINHYSGILQVYGRGDVIVKGSLIDLAIAASLIFILYPIYGMRGAAGAVVISTLVQVVYYLYYTSVATKRRILELIPVAGLLIKLMATGAVFYVLRLAMAGSQPIIAVAVGLLIFLLVSTFWSRKFLFPLPDFRKRRF